MPASFDRVSGRKATRSREDHDLSHVDSKGELALGLGDIGQAERRGHHWPNAPAACEIHQEVEDAGCVHRRPHQDRVGQVEASYVEPYFLRTMLGGVPAWQ